LRGLRRHERFEKITMCDYINISDVSIENEDLQAFLYEFISSPEGENFFQEVFPQTNGTKIKTEPVDNQDSFFSSDPSPCSSECPSPQYPNDFSFAHDDFSNSCSDTTPSEVSSPVSDFVSELELCQSSFSLGYAPPPAVPSLPNVTPNVIPNANANANANDIKSVYKSYEREEPITVPVRVEVLLLQKKRGNGGLWQPVVRNERIRVDKNKGKILKLSVKINGIPIDFKDFSVKVTLINLLQPDIEFEEGDGFCFLQTRNSSEFIGKEIKLKLLKICKDQRFKIQLQRNGTNFHGFTNDFRSDDNGKETSNKTVRAKRKEITVAPSLPVGYEPSKLAHLDFNNLFSHCYPNPFVYQLLSVPQVRK